MSPQLCAQCGARLGPWEPQVSKSCLSHSRLARGQHDSNAAAAIRALEQQSEPLSVYDIARVVERDQGRLIPLATLQATISGDARFCWAGKGTYGLYRHGLVPGPRTLAGVGTIFLLALARLVTLETLAFAMRHAGYRFQEFSVLAALRAARFVEVSFVDGEDQYSSRGWLLEIVNSASAWRFVKTLQCVPHNRRSTIDELVAETRSRVEQSIGEMRRRLSASGDAATSARDL